MEERILFSQKTTIFVPVDNDSRIKPMSKDSLCAQHTDCSGCPKAMESTLIHRNLLRGQHIPKDKCTQNCMLFMIEGELLINSDEHPGTTLHEKQFILQAIGSKYEILALMNPRLFYLINDVAAYLDESTPACGKYIDLKCQEMVYMITNYYPLPQLRAFFYPISTYTESFQYFVMQNYSKAKNVEEFAHLGGYNTTTFRRLFRNLYGVPVYEWMLEKKREGILEDLQHSNMRITEICNRYGFDSLSHLAHFCKDSFGDTPRALRKKAANGEKIGKITD